MRLLLLLGEDPVALRLTRRGEDLAVTLPDGRVLEGQVRWEGDGSLTLEHAGRRWRLAGTASGERRQLWLAGRTWTYARAEALTRGEGPAAGAMTSAIPAVVREVLVAPGERVEAGQRVLLLESMKMVLPIVAERAGRVGAILCAVGDAIAPGVPLLTIDEGAE